MGKMAKSRGVRGRGLKSVPERWRFAIYGEAPLLIPTGYKVVDEAPSAEALNPFHPDSDGLLGSRIILRFEAYGWCEGVLQEKNTNRTRKIAGEMINFIGKFDMDEVTTDLALASAEYDPSQSAAYGSWLLLEKETEPTPLALEQ